MIDVDYSLMYVTDDSIRDDAIFFKILEAALKGGATIIQLREKEADTLSFYKRAMKCKSVCSTYKVPLLVNDRLDIALSVDADGIHIGQKDLPYAVARRIMGGDKIIGVSVSNKRQAIESEGLDADYIGISPVFGTTTKTTDLAAPLGIDGLKAIRKLYSKPIVCIGGIDASNTKSLIQNGANGIAVVSAISKAEHPQIATRELKNILCQTGIN